MRLTHGTRKALSENHPLVALLVPEGKHAELPGGPLGARAVALLKSKVFKAGAGEMLTLHADERGGPRALLLVGTGKARNVTTDQLRIAAMHIGKQAASLGAKKVVVGAVGSLDLDAAGVSAVGEGLVLSTYRYKLKKDDKPAARDGVVVSDVRGAAGLLAVAKAVSEGTNTARDLGDLPANIADPTHLRNVARKICTAGKLRFKAHDKAALKRQKMGGILAVNQGSDLPCYLLEMEYKPARYKHTVCVVGKGLTFDSGGI